jgi:hypothetical protein
MRAITLVPVFHDQQAPGRSRAALDAFVAEAWGPLIDALHAAPRVRCGLVLSGALARHLAEHAPERFARMRELSARGQVEVVGGTSHGAALHLVPERDAVQQVRQHLRWLRTRLGVPVRGVWPTLRAWDPAVPRIVARAGGAYTFVDEGLVAAGGALPASGGWLVTERGGATMATVPLDHALGARMPFVEHDALIAGLRARCEDGERVRCLPISIEALGRSDEARDWCFSGATPWLPHLLRSLVQHAAWLKTAVPWQLVDRTPAAGRAWPASGTPGPGAADMLPAAAARTWVQVQAALADDPSPALAGLAPYLNGPPLESALSRYDVAARLHRAGLRASVAVAALRREAQAANRPAGPVEAVAARLTEGQAALPLDPRVGGGLREPRVRHAAFAALVDAELHAFAQASRHPGGVEKVDAGPDGHPEVVLRQGGVRMIVRPGVGGAISELALEGVGNFVNTLARTHEHWHAELGEDTAIPMLVDEEDDASVPAPTPPLDDYEEDEPTDLGAIGAPASEPSGEGPRLETPRIDRDAGLRAADAGPRLCLLDHLLGESTTLDALSRGQHDEQGDLAGGPYRLERAQEDDGRLVVLMGRDGRVRQGLEEDRLLGVLKRVSLGPERGLVEVHWELWNRSKTPIHSTFAAELNLCLDGVLGPDRLLHLDGLEPVRLDTACVGHGVRAAEVRFGAARLGLRTPDAATVYHYPIYVPGRRGGRVVPTYQGMCLHIAWPLGLWGGEHASFSLTLQLSGADG